MEEIEHYKFAEATDMLFFLSINSRITKNARKSILFFYSRKTYFLSCHNNVYSNSVKRFAIALHQIADSIEII